MALITCKKCGKQISSNATECVHCGENLDNRDQVETLEQNNILLLLKYARSIKYVYITLGILAFIGGCILDTPIGVLFAIACFISSVIHPVFIENKALILKNLNEINIKVR